VELIRKTKAEGVDVTAETAPHYLTLTEQDLQEDGRFKMNPPLRGAEDRQAILEAVADGTLEILVTDHAPHSAEEKSKGLRDSAFGVVGLETALSANWTALVQPGLITPERLAELMSVNPRRRFALPEAEIRAGARADLCIFDPREEYVVDSSGFYSKGRSTPFEGMKLRGRVKLTVCGNQIVYDAGDRNEKDRSI
jgi:dihydroorotase